ncbi:hypothetical protein C3L33_20147, partial [Rhododendron williamsianum]
MPTTFGVFMLYTGCAICVFPINPSIKPEHHSKYGYVHAYIGENIYSKLSRCRISSEPKPTKKGQGTDSGGSTLQTYSASVSGGKVRFLAYWVSSEASLLLERIHSTYKDTFTKFSMKGQKLPTVLLESFASFVESMSTTKVNEVQEDVLKQASLSIEDFEQVGLELSWLKKRLEEAKKANKHAESIVYVDLCEAALKVGRAKVRELEEGLVKAKAELEDCSTDLPNSLAVNDYLLLDVVGRLRAPKANDAELNLFLEVEHSRRGLPKIPPTVCSDDILLFFKLYDPLKEELRYVGRFYVKADGMPEIHSEPNVRCDPVDKMVTFRDSQISLEDESRGQCGHPNVPSFLEYVYHHQISNSCIWLSLERSKQIKPEHHSKRGSEPQQTERGQGTISGGSTTQTHSANSASGKERGRGTISGGSTTQTHSANAPSGKVRFLAYWVSSEASLLLERIHHIQKNTFTRFSMKGEKLQTLLLESFASFVESMSTTKVNEVQEDVLRQATLSIEDFEQVGLELSWLKKRLEEAKKANKHAESLVYVDLCETALKVGRAKVRELEEGLVKAKAELEDCSTDLPNSVAVNDYLLLDVV